ncbi:septum site-determining protein Ssd [Pengzhenrongella sicca]|uniref:septum site-determining protein Ssd n=1 Tax=Pengzhenrongella sicca TaxID=2819238 RepID=UPI001D0C0137|nr:septum site-determining protein Ssd [Pengzhenrongella sicca]
MPVVGVVGARGGLGASSLAAALARRLARGGSTPVALVDLDGAGGGLDVLLGLEEAGGLRWPDLRGARGDVVGDELTALLPRWSGVTVLSADRSRPGAPGAEVLAAVLDALGACHAHVVLDLDRAQAVAGDPARRCAVLFVLAGRDLRSVAGVLALRAAALGAVADVRLVVRGPAPGGLGVLELAHVVDLPVAASMRPQRGHAAALERGGGPVAPARGPLARAVARMSAGLG